MNYSIEEVIDIYGQLQSGKVFISSESQEEAIEIQYAIREKYNVEVQYAPGFGWINGKEICRGFVFTNRS